ncbi:MAG TPA: pitrilysin family protein, partial [Candidatus Polarisedimenticolia bacterium]|nr:pitrilysin family protein [Candidatus Polarisedimenticolia bacterium]
VVGARRVILGNGLRVIVRPNAATRSVAVHLVIPAGAAADPDGRSGAAHLMARLLDRGADGLSAERIAIDFENRGIGFVARARLDSLDLTARLLARDLPFLLERLETLVASPAFPEAEVATERARLLTELLEQQQDTAAMAEERLADALFPAGHPYHAPPAGRRETVESIDRGTLVGLHAQRVRPEGAVLSIAGGIDADATFMLAERIFGAWRPAGLVKPLAFPDAPLLDHPQVIVHPLAGKTQADVALGFDPNIDRRGVDLQATIVMSSVLGEFGMGGRLGLTVRENSGLAYYSHSYVWTGRAKGPLIVRAGVAPDNVPRAVALIRKVVGEFLRRGPKPRELADSKQSLAANLPRRFETNPQAAAILADCEFQGLGFDYPDSVPARIAAVDAAAVLASARRHLAPDRAVLVVAGPTIDPNRLT